MTITLSKEELFAFQSELNAWFDARSIFVITTITSDGRGFGYAMESRVTNLIEQYVKENPKPDWRTLL